MAHLFRLGLFLFVLATTACELPAMFETPIPDGQDVQYDERLIGRWYSIDENENVARFLRLSKSADTGKLEAIYSITADEPGIAWWVAEAFASEVDGRVYFNLEVQSAAVSGTAAAFDQDGDPDNPFLQIFQHVGPEDGGGIMIATAEIDGNDQLSLRILSDAVPEDQKLNSRHIDCGGTDGLECGYPLYDLSKTDLIELIRATPNEELFSIDLGLFARIKIN